MSAATTIPVADDADPVELIDLMYLGRRSLKIVMQRIQIPKSKVNDCLYDAILVGWAKIRNNTEIDFICAWDSDRTTLLANKESLAIYTMRALLDTNRSLLADLEPYS